MKKESAINVILFVFGIRRQYDPSNQNDLLMTELKCIKPCGTLHSFACREMSHVWITRNFHNNCSTVNSQLASVTNCPNFL